MQGVVQKGVDGVTATWDDFLHRLDENPRATVVAPFVLTALMGAGALSVGTVGFKELGRQYMNHCYYDDYKTAESDPVCVMAGHLWLPTNEAYRDQEQGQLVERLEDIQKACKDDLGKWAVGVRDYELGSIECADSNGDGVPESVTVTMEDGSAKFDLQTGAPL